MDSTCLVQRGSNLVQGFYFLQYEWDLQSQNYLLVCFKVRMSAAVHKKKEGTVEESGQNKNIVCEWHFIIFFTLTLLRVDFRRTFVSQSLSARWNHTWQDIDKSTRESSQSYNLTIQLQSFIYEIRQFLVQYQDLLCYIYCFLVGHSDTMKFSANLSKFELRYSNYF